MAEAPAKAGSFYDRIARLYNMTFKFNGYEKSIARYLRRHPLPIKEGARVLDGGCGTGLLTLALLRTVEVPVRIAAIDLSGESLNTARKVVMEKFPERSSDVWFGQANLLKLPFPDHSFDLVVTSGALEYCPLRDGLCELARVLVPGGHLLNFPVRPTLAARVLEVLFQFKSHPTYEIMESTSYYFRIVDEYHFSPLEPFGWTKVALLAQKI
jgi:ubiquinone/menaquinone biosynthesis C-methylase UbiE